MDEDPGGNLTPATAFDLIRSAYAAADPLEVAAGLIDELGPLELHQLAGLRSLLEQMHTVAGIVKRAVDQRMAGDLGPDNSYVLDGTVYRVRPSSRFRCREEALLVEFLGNDWPLAFNLREPKIGALKAIAESRGLSAQAVVDTFGEYVEGPGVLTAMPIDKAPKFLQRLSNGATAYPPLCKTLAPGSPVSGDPVASQGIVAD